MNRCYIRCLPCAWVSSALLLTAGGCAVFSNPFRDEFAGHPQVSTASANGVHAAGLKAEARRRAFRPASIGPANGAVTHGPLYFEDGFEDQGSDDGRFAWKSEDYFQFAYWRARFLWNAIVFPVHAVLAPPWRAMESDGESERRLAFWHHDAERADRSRKTGRHETETAPTTDPSND